LPLRSQAISSLAVQISEAMFFSFVLSCRRVLAGGAASQAGG